MYALQVIVNGPLARSARRNAVCWPGADFKNGVDPALGLKLFDLLLYLHAVIARVEAVNRVKTCAVLLSSRARSQVQLRLVKQAHEASKLQRNSIHILTRAGDCVDIVFFVQGPPRDF